MQIRTSIVDKIKFRRINVLLPESNTTSRYIRNAYNKVL